MSVTVKNIVKNHGDIRALRGITFEVTEGELFGLIGPDGAGKTTLFHILTTLLLPDEGDAHVLGIDVIAGFRNLRRRIGYMPGRFSLYPDLSVEENLSFFATIFNTTVEENYHLIQDIYHQIEPFRKRRAGDLSGGMKQKLALSCALIHKPDILFLDEPTTGVDAVSRREFWDMLGRLRVSGLTILVSTPYMDEASRCDRVALMDRGEILSVNTPAGISREFGRPLYSVTSGRRYELLKALRACTHAHSVFTFGDEVHYTDLREDFRPEMLESYLQQLGFDDVRIEQITPGVEDTLISLMSTQDTRDPIGDDNHGHKEGTNDGYNPAIKDS